MNTKTQTIENYSVEKDPEMIKYWMQRGPKTAAFLLVIPGCALIGYGAGLLATRPLPYVLMGCGAGMLVWGLAVVLSK
jgi:hypothetical protein